MSDASDVRPPGLYFHDRAYLEHDPRQEMPWVPETPEGVEAVESPTSAWRLARERYPEVVRAP